MIIVALVIGLLAGVALPLAFEHVIAIGMFTTMFTSALNPVYAVGLLGLGIASFLKTNAKTAIKEESDAIDATEEKEYVSVLKKVSDRYVTFFWLLVSSAVFCLFANNIYGISNLLMPMSIIMICANIIRYILSANSKTSLIRTSIGVIIIAILAIVTINIKGNNANVFSYFLGTVTIPSILIKNKTKEQRQRNSNDKLNLSSALLYGAGSNLMVAPILINQTIIMGSAKDALGTIINSDFSVLLDPYRASIAVIVIIFAMIYFHFFMYNDCVKAVNAHKAKRRNKRGISIIISIISFAIAVSRLSLPLVLLMTIGGLIANILVKDKQALRSAAVPALLLAGISFG